MKKHTLRLAAILFLLLFATDLYAQQKAADVVIFEAYDAYYRDIGKWLQQSGQPRDDSRPSNIRMEAQQLKDDVCAGNVGGLIPAGHKPLDDGQIFSSGKQSVFLTGKLLKSSTGEVNFELTGTGFVLTGNGTCVTNYHVLNSLMQSESPETRNDSVYFIITADKKLYYINHILGYSRNSDLAIFSVDAPGAALKPLALGQPAPVGTPIYCISHPSGHFYTYAKGIVSRNVKINPAEIGGQYNPNGVEPLRREITADFAIGSSGGPVLDRYGNLTGVIISTLPIAFDGKDASGKPASVVQMMVKETSPVEALVKLLQTKANPN